MVDVKFCRWRTLIWAQDIYMVVVLPFQYILSCIIGENIEGGVGILRWALNHWSSQPVSFVILHLNASLKDFVLTPFGKLPASQVNPEKLELFRIQEQERVDKLLNKYKSLGCKVKTEILKVDISEEPVHKALVGLISSHGIRKLVMGFKDTKSLSWVGKNQTNGCIYVQKHKPEFCELFVVCGGRSVTIKDENVDEGAYIVDECGVIIGDFRKKSKEKGSFKGWLGRKLSSPNHVVSPSKIDDIAREIESNKWEDNVEEIESYIECLLASNSPELEQLGDKAIDPPEITKTSILKSSLSRSAVLRAIEQAEKMVEQNKNEAKANEARRRKAERASSFCKQRAAQIEANLREEITNQSNLKEELDAVRGQHHEISGNITGSNSKLTSEFDQQAQRMISLEAFSLEKSSIEAEMARMESENAEMFRLVEEIRRQRDLVKRRTEYYKEREAMAATNGLNYVCREFSEEELIEATDVFSEEKLIAAGPRGAIYRGRINQTNVAIKLKLAFTESLYDFKDQVELLRSISHPNILAMIGACTERRYIVFEYMQHGSLNNILFPSSPQNRRHLPLPWHKRISIAANVCSAIGFFLHSSQARPTAHVPALDASHVLLDHNFTAKITGLCFSVSDIPALGLIILQLLTGKEDISVREVRLAFENTTVGEIMDQTAGSWPLELATEFARIGLRCSEEESAALSIGAMVQEVEDLRARAEGQISNGGDERARLEVPDAFLCPIVQEVMKEPYVAADGFSYELGAIKEWLSTGHETSPMTNLKLKNKRLIANHSLHYLIRDWRDKSKPDCDDTH